MFNRRIEANKFNVLSQHVKATKIEREGIYKTDPTETWWELEAVNVKGRCNHLGYARIELTELQAMEVAFNRLKQDQKIMLDALTNPIPMNDYSFLTR